MDPFSHPYPSGDDDGVEAALNEHPEVRTLWERRGGGEVEINGVNPIVHVLFEGIVENQLREGQPPETGSTLERLMARGLYRHAARGVISALLVKHFYYVMKDKKPFPTDQYRRQLGLLGERAVGRNQPCPCGSGRKLKACCAEFLDIRISNNAGQLILGSGAYISGRLVIKDPLDPLTRLENRVHIARFFDKGDDPEGARQVLRENVVEAGAFRARHPYWLIGALIDLIVYCRRYPEFREEETAAAVRLIPLLGADGLDRGDAARLLREDALPVLRRLAAAEGVVDLERYKAVRDLLRDPEE